MFSVDLRLIPTAMVCRVLVAGPIIAVMYLLYAFGITWKIALDNGRYQVTRPFAWVYMVAFAILNTGFNWIVGTFIYFEWPYHFFFTSRTQSYIDGKQGARHELAEFFAILLNRYDPNHVKER